VVGGSVQNTGVIQSGVNLNVITNTQQIVTNLVIVARGLGLAGGTEPMDPVW
jgi:hypothetical protein